MPTLQPIAARNTERTRWIHQKVVEALNTIFPYQTNKYTVSISDIIIDAKNYTMTQQKDALVSGRTLNEPVYATLTITDNSTNKAVQTLRRYKIADIPFLTQRLTMVLEGNDYSISNQLRLKPGAYSRRRENGVLEVFFNLAAGKNFRMTMDPVDGIFMMEVDNTRIPVYPIMIAFGIQESDLNSLWGQELLAKNKTRTGSIDVAITNLYSKFFRVTEESRTMTTTDKVRKIGAYLSNTRMDPDVNASTLGQRVGTVTINSLMNATKKILEISRNDEMTDDRDNLKYQTIHTIDDVIQENIIKTAPELLRKIKYKMDNLPKDKKPGDVIPNNMFGPNLKKFLMTTSIASPLPQINPVDIIGRAHEVTSLGPGGIKDVRMVRPETRQVNSSHIGIIDPVNTKENEKAGITLFATQNSYKDIKGNIYTRIKNVKTNREDYVSSSQLESKVVAFPGQNLSKPTEMVEVIYQGRIQRMPASKVEYQLADTEKMFSVQTNLIPFMNSVSGGRNLMASKHYSHSLPLVEREEPLVQTQSRSGYKTQEEFTASMFVPKATMDGRITKITKDQITIENDKGGKQTDFYETNFPLNQKTFLHTDPTVKVGDKVKKNQLLGESIYTKNNKLALGTNLEVGYITYKGLNLNDGIVISEGAAKKLTSMHMNRVTYMLDENHSANKNKFTILFPNKFTIDQLKNIEANGVIKSGTVLSEGDPIIMGVEKTDLSAEQSLLGQFNKKLYRPYKEDVLTWDYSFPGYVTDVSVAGNKINVLVKSEQPAQVGDKISNRSAGKGVITAIVKDEDMFKNEAGKTLDVLVSPTGVISRQNPSQILETAAAKVARKTGQPIIIDNFSKVDNHKYVQDLLKEHGIKDKETLFDPKHNRTIPNIMTGPQYILKQSNQVDTGFSARDFGRYDSNEMPAKGGKDGAKTIGMLDINSLISHNARNILQEISSVKGTKNTKFWNNYKMGLPLPAPKTPFAYDKFLGMMTASGIKINNSDNSLIASPLTDRDIQSMSRGEIKNPFTVRAKDLRPEKGGLFDPGVTGGPNGKNWSHIHLAEPVINPVMKRPVMTLLNYSQAALDKKIKEEGVQSIERELGKVNVDQRIQTLNQQIPTLTHSKLDKAVKEFKYLDSLKRNNLSPKDAYILHDVPVLPPIMRPIVKMPGSRDLQVSASNRLYSDIIHNNNAINMLRGKVDDKDLGNLRGTLQQSVEALVGTSPSPNIKLNKQGVKGILSTIAGDVPKEGFFQSKIVSKPQDLVARGVIIPNPNVNLDEIDVPEEILWKMYQPFIVRRLVSKGYSATAALDMVNKKSELAKQEMLIEIKDRPVLFNRAPNLHKYNIIAAYPKPSMGKAIGISPFAEKGLAADYDGDAAQLHVPVSYKAVNEAKQMTLSNLLFADKTKEKNLMVKPELDTNYGMHKGINATPFGKVQKFNDYEEMRNAYKNGKIGLQDSVEIKR